MSYRNSSILFLMLCSSLLFLVSCTNKKIDPTSQKILKSITNLRLNLYAEPLSLDPAKVVSTVENYILQQINRGLIQIDLAGQIKPAIAEHWEISKDLKVYTFYLRKNVKFHHGRTVTAQDFVYSFNRILDPKIKTPMQFYVKNIKRVDAIDQYTLRIQLSHPYLPIIKIFATTYTSVVPKELIENSKLNFSKHPVGAGPFQFQGYDHPTKKITLTAHKDYFEGPSRLKKIECFILSDAEAYYRFLANDLDYFKIREIDFAERLTQKGFPVHRTLQHGIAFLGINHGYAPLNDKDIRKALMLSIDWQAYKKSLTLNYEVADQILPRDLFGRIDTSSYERYNIEHAKTLIQKSKYKDYFKHNDIKLTKHVLHKNEKEDQFLKNEFQKIGIRLSIKYLDRGPYHQAYTSKDFQLLYYRGVPFISDPHAIFGFFHSKDSNNYFHYNNPNLDYLLDKGQITENFDTRQKVYEQVSHSFYDDTVVIPLYYWDEIHVRQPNIKLGEYRYASNEDLYIITKK